VFGDDAVLDDVYVVGVREDVERVCDEDAGLVCERALKYALLENVLADVGVDGAERVVEEDDVRFRVCGAGERYACLVGCSVCISVDWLECAYLLTTAGIGIHSEWSRPSAEGTRT